MAISIAGCDNGDEEKLEKIPMDEIYCTAIQKGLKTVSFDEKAPFQDRLQEFRRLLPFASNVFLTRAKDIDEAAGAGISFKAYDDIATPDVRDDRPIWLVVFFGHGHSGPRKWTIDSVEFSQSKIRVSYSLPSGLQQTTRDMQPYFAFVRLARLKAGTYTLELRDSSKKESTLSRKVRVKLAER
jgi:hypothetical protein